MKVGLFGGSFNPVHKGHLKLAGAALKQLKLSKVYFILSPRPPLKHNHLAPVPSRLRMLKAALRGKKRFAAATWELRRRGPSYSVTTLRSYHRRHPKEELLFIVGSDVLPHFHKWRQPKEILRLARLVVGRRPGHTRQKKNKLHGHSPVYLKGIFPDISATKIRRRVRAGTSLKSCVPPAVERLIKKENLFADRP